MEKDPVVWDNVEDHDPGPSRGSEEETGEEAGEEAGEEESSERHPELRELSEEEQRGMSRHGRTSGGSFAGQHKRVFSFGDQPVPAEPSEFREEFPRVEEEEFPAGTSTGGGGGGAPLPEVGTSGASYSQPRDVQELIGQLDALCSDLPNLLGEQGGPNGGLPSP